jgi:phosphoserine phosphatase
LIFIEGWKRGFPVKKRVAPVKLVAFDLDSTLIDVESLVEFARIAGKEKEVQQLTRQAMAGEIEYGPALEERVRLLKGIESKKVYDVVGEISLMEGARETVRELKKRKIKTAIVTGGFDIVAERVRKDLGIEDVISNHLEVNDDLLTGEVSGPIRDGQSKAEALVGLAETHGIPLEECAAVGDGANDIEMLKKAGVAIAFHPADALKEVADVVIAKKDLKEILPHLLGEREAGPIEETEPMDRDQMEKRLNSLLREKEELELQARLLKKEISGKRKDLRELGQKKRDLISAIRPRNEEANKYRRLRNEINKKIQKFKKEREEANAPLRELIEEYKGLREKAPSGDFRSLQRQIKSLEWKLQTSVLDIKKEDELVEKIKKCKKELAGFESLIKVSQEIDRLKKIAKKSHEMVLQLSEESQTYHEKFLAEVEKIKEIETEIDKVNAQRETIASSLDRMRGDLETLSQRIQEFEKEAKELGEALGVLEEEMSEEEMKEAAKAIYDRFMKGEKLNLEDIYLLRRYNFV